MNHPLLLQLPLFALVLTATNVIGARGTLKADGMFRIRGADMTHATITVVPTGAKAYSLPLGTTDFILELPLNDTYLVEFVREGCPSKQVYFDTSVPVDDHAKTFGFPFKVTLQHMDADKLFAYAGPVGFVRWMDPGTDFGYETVYIIQVDPELKERMHRMQENGIDPKLILPPSAMLVLDRPRGGGEGTSIEVNNGEGTLAANVSEVPLLVHVLTAFVAPVAQPAMALAAVALPAVLHAPIAVLEAVQQFITAVLEPAPELAPSASVDPMVLAANSTRTDEMIVGKNQVTRVVRYTDAQGSPREFRKVTHAYGAVFFFDQVGSITERVFAQQTALL